MVYAPTLEKAQREVDDFLHRSRVEDVFFPHLAQYTTISSREREFFFEFLAPSDTSGYAVAFRVWKSRFVPSDGWVLGDPVRTPITIGTTPKPIDAAALARLLEVLWWENNGHRGGVGMLALPKVLQGERVLQATMPVISATGNEGGSDEIRRDVWKLELNRRTGEITRTINPDIVCVGRPSPTLRIIG
jgi:hypothetical protein